MANGHTESANERKKVNKRVESERDRGSCTLTCMLQNEYIYSVQYESKEGMYSILLHSDQFPKPKK